MADIDDPIYTQIETPAGTDRVLAYRPSTPAADGPMQYIEVADLLSEGSATNLGATVGASTVIITSSTGTDATIPAATESLAGVMLPAEKRKLASLAQKNKSVITLTSASALSDFQASVSLASGDIDFTQTGGDDFYATLSDGTELPIYVESFDAEAETALIWLRCPSLIVGDTIVNLYYGPQGPVSKSSPERVFDFYDDFSRPARGWEKYAANPILSADATEGGVLARDPTILYENGAYKMWYWGTTGIYYATSTDGITWSKYGQVIAAGGGLPSQLGRPSITKKDATYYLYVNDETNIRLWTFTDPTGSYTNVGNVMTPSLAWEDGKIKSPWVIWDADANAFKMWYSAGEITPIGLPYTEPKVIGYATSSNGSSWTKNPDPIVEASANGGWRDSAIMTLHPTKIGGKYFAILSAGDQHGVSRLGIVSSDDGIAWDVSDSDLAVDLGGSGAWDQTDIYTGALLEVDGVWRIWYNARNSADSSRESIGIATLVDKPAQLDTSKWWKQRATINSGIALDVDWQNYGVALKRRVAATAFASLLSHDKITDAVVEADIVIGTEYYGSFTTASIDYRNGGRITSSAFDTYRTNLQSGTSSTSLISQSKMVNGTETVFSPTSTTPTRRRGQKARVSVSVVGTSISSSIDGTSVLTNTDATYSDGFVGFSAYQGDAIVSMFRVRKPGTLPTVAITAATAAPDLVVPTEKTPIEKARSELIPQSSIVLLPEALAAKQPLSAVLTATTASFTTADETKLAGIAAGATVGATWGTNLASIPTVITDYAAAADYAARRTLLGLGSSDSPTFETVTATVGLVGNSLTVAGDGSVGGVLSVGGAEIDGTGSTAQITLPASGTVTLATTDDVAAAKPIECLMFALSDETTTLTTGTAKLTFRMPYAFTLSSVRASVGTAPTGSTLVVDINENGTTILSTKLSIDASEKTSTTAATPPVISDTSLADDAEITFDIDQVGSTIAGAGLKVTLIGRRT